MCDLLNHLLHMVDLLKRLLHSWKLGFLMEGSRFKAVCLLKGPESDRFIALYYSFMG